jgi:hypothetical protein
LTLLFLDDLRNPSDCLYFSHLNVNLEIYLQDWVIVRSYTVFVKWIETNGLPDFISFDHDLGLPELPEFEEQNGMTCAKWLVNYCMDHNVILPDFAVHSSNPVGKQNIEGLLMGFGKLNK